MKFTKLFSAIALFGSMAATAHASTVVTVNVKNSTATQAEYTYENSLAASILHQEPFSHLPHQHSS